MTFLPFLFLRSNHPTRSSTQESTVVSNPTKVEQRPKILTVKKIHTLKRLEAISQKYSETVQSPREKNDNRNQLKIINPKEKKSSLKSSIPIPKVVSNKIVEKRILLNRRIGGENSKEQEISETKKTKTQPVKIPSINSLSSDSLEACTESKHPKSVRNSAINSNRSKIDQKKIRSINRNVKEFYLNKADSANNGDEDSTHSIGINTELLCPCIPCVIHDETKGKSKNEKRNDKTANSSSRSEEKIELLYQNPTVLSPINNKPLKMTYVDNISTKTSYEYMEHSSITHLEDNEIDLAYDSSKSPIPKCESVDSLQNDINLEDEKFDDSLHEDGQDGKTSEDCELSNDHHSGDTYTKFTEDANNLEEFMNITDQLIINNEQDDLCLGLHTPNTSSIENEFHKDFEESPGKQIFSDALSKVKEKCKEVLRNDVLENNVTIEAKLEIVPMKHVARQVSDLEHVTVYQVRNQKHEPIKKDVFEFSLPPIGENNKSINSAHHSKKKMERMYKPNRKINMLRELKKNDTNFKTFIMKENLDDSASEEQSISSEAPPLKLPRIENKKKRSVHAL